jgi:hypothetical protein
MAEIKDCPSCGGTGEDLTIDPRGMHVIPICKTCRNAKQLLILDPAELEVLKNRVRLLSVELASVNPDREKAWMAALHSLFPAEKGKCEVIEVGTKRELIGRLASGHEFGGVTIEIWDVSARPPVEVNLADNRCREIGETGLYWWDMENFSVQPMPGRHYQYIMHDMIDGATSNGHFES